MKIINHNASSPHSSNECATTVFGDNGGAIMGLDSLKLLRNVLLRTAVISLLLAYFLAAATVGLWDVWTELTSKVFRTPVSACGPLISNFFALIKFYMIFVLLAPALGLHWEIKKREKHHSAN